ncbi:MAG TPA: DnaJ C-terminal domain-containing protein, partial [Aeromicrobium sp.]|nr:DnaJ C-terminal domain-containing protein [Aeromicrobium sp.]
KLARQHHPDVNKGDAAAERRFKEVSEANEVLADPEKRKLYDQLGSNWQAYQQAGARPGGGGPAGEPFAGFGGHQGFGGGAGGPGGVRFEYRGNPEDLSGFSDFFRTFFGGAAEETGGRVRTARTSSIEDLFAGLGDTDSLGANGRGSGRAGGSGQRSTRPRLEAEAEFSLEEVASGAKRLLDIEGKRIEVNIPAGVADAQRIRFSGVGPGGGDVYLKVKVAGHGLFARKGNDLHSEVPVTLREALLGGEVHVRTLGGRVLLRIPPETQNGRTFRLAGKGLPKFRGEGNGDLYVKVRVVLPSGLSHDASAAAQSFLDLVDQPDPRDRPG